MVWLVTDRVVHHDIIVLDLTGCLSNDVDDLDVLGHAAGNTVDCAELTWVVVSLVQPFGSRVLTNTMSSDDWWRINGQVYFIPVQMGGCAYDRQRWPWRGHIHQRHTQH